MNAINTRLPVELLAQSFSNLKTVDLLSVSLVCRLWNVQAREGAKLKNRAKKETRFAALKNFVKLLAERMEDPKIQKVLQEIPIDRPVLNLKAVQELIKETKLLLAENLKDVENLEDLAELVKGNSDLNDFFSLVNLFKRQNTHTHPDELSKISLEFFELGYFSKAWNITTRIPDVQNLDNICLNTLWHTRFLIFQKLYSRQDFDSVFQLLTVLMADERNRVTQSQFFMLFSLHVLNSYGDVGKAFAIAKLIQQTIPADVRITYFRTSALHALYLKAKEQKDNHLDEITKLLI